MIVVSNTSPISNLATVERLHLLQKIYHQIVIPSAVYQELNVGEAEAIILAIELQADELLDCEL